jgi:hypothetical protein
MKSSKDLFFDMKSKEYAHDFSKKQAEQTGLDLVNNIFETGDYTPIQVYSNIVRLKAVVDSADKAFRERLKLVSANSYNGVTFTPKNGSESLNYDEDLVYANFDHRLKQRIELLKYAAKSDEPIYDSEGCEVPKVSKKYNKSSIVITF